MKLVWFNFCMNLKALFRGDKGTFQKHAQNSQELFICRKKNKL